MKVEGEMKDNYIQHSDHKRRFRPKTRVFHLHVRPDEAHELYKEMRKYVSCAGVAAIVIIPASSIKTSTGQ